MQMLRLLITALMAMLLWAAAPVRAADAVLEVGDAKTQHIKLFGYLFYLEDPQGGLRIQDVASAGYADRFIPDTQSPEKMDFGSTASAYWLRLTLRNGSEQPVTRMISFPLSHTERIELHRPNNRSAPSPLVTGVRTPQSERPYRHWLLVLPVVLQPASTETIYLRVSSAQRLLLRPEIWDERSLDDTIHSFTNIAHFLNGWMGSLIVFHLLLLLVLRESLYGYYLGRSVSVVLAQGLYNGSLHEVLLPGHGQYVAQALAFSLTAVAVFGLHFNRKCLDLRTHLPSMDRICQVTAWGITLVIPIHIAVTGRYSRLVFLAALLSFVVGEAAQAYAAWRKVPFARPVFMSWLLTIPLFVWIVLAQFNWLPPLDYPAAVFSLGVAAELTLLTRAVLLRFISMQRANRQARTQALRASEVRLQDMRDADRELEERVQQRSHELEQTQAQLQAARLQAEQANQAKQNFLANMSHEIRTPLNAMLGMGYLASEYPMEPQARNYLGKSSAAAQSLLGLVNDILEASRLDAGKMEIETIAYSLRKVLQDVVDEHTTAAHQKGLTLQLQVDAQLPDQLQGDAQKLRQMVDKLLSNAVKFTREGSVQVSAQRTTRPDGTLALSLQVTDTGNGMEPEELAQAFAPFAQADSSLTRHHTGVGLGLRIAHGLAELLGGGLTASSVPGQGSTFTLTVPLH